jgi:hypothetical protein
MKKLLIVPILLTILTAGWAVSSTVAAGNDHDSKSIVGAWEVTAEAPYAPHLFTFHEDGTMTTTNPTNVQEDPSDPHGGTNDSLGMGLWKVQKKHGVNYVVGTFEQLNAYVDNHEPAATLSVSFKVQLASDGKSFVGPATVKYDGVTVADSKLTGEQRILVDQSAVDSL